MGERLCLKIKMKQLSENKQLQKEYRLRAREIVSKMNLEEKISQMLNASPAIKHLNIPEYNWWNEAIHGVARAGVATMFPQAIGMAAMFDEDMMETVGDAISTEARAKYNMQQRYNDADIYKGLTFWAPNVNIFRDPRWGRGHETYGEDPYLTSRLGVRFTQGLQGHNDKYLKAAACAKHFAVHSGPEELRHFFDAKVSKQDMYETYFPAFRALVKEAKVEAVMGAYNRVNGEPCCGSKTLLKDILMNEWGFEGHIVSDCWAIKDFHEGHKVTKDRLESVALAVNNGCCINCGNMFIHLFEAVEKGMVDEATIDEAVIKLFTTRIKLGILDNKEGTVFDEIPYSKVDSKEMQELNLDVAQKSVVLLKNEEHLLPLDKNTIKTIGVIGPNANSREALIGNYVGTPSRYTTVLEGIQDYVKGNCRVLYSQGCDLYKENVEKLARANDRISEVKCVCDESDVIIAVMGLDAGLEGEEADEGNEYASGDKPDLNLPGYQQEILECIKASGKPAVLILLSGSALAINWADENMPAIIQGWYPGPLGGKAIANILFGDANPQGKLPITFYKSTQELPDFTDYSMRGRTYRYMVKQALYPFGYGLSYTDFEFSNLSIKEMELRKEGIRLCVKVKNTGKLEGICTPQIYIKDEHDGTPNPTLKAFGKERLAVGEEKEISFHLPLRAFALFDEEGIEKVAAGTFRIYVGDSQPDERSIELLGRIPLAVTIQNKKEWIFE